MCNVHKYKEIYQELKKLTPDDTLELVLESEDPEEQEFFELLGDYLLQTAQKKVILENKF